MQAYSFFRDNLRNLGFLCGLIIAQFAALSRFGTGYLQIIKWTGITLIVIYGILLLYVFAFSLISSLTLDLSGYKDRNFSMLFTLITLAQQANNGKVNSRRVYSVDLFFLLVGAYLILYIIFTYLPAAVIMESHRMLQIVLEELDVRRIKGNAKKSKFFQ